MSGDTNIEWADVSWNPTIGCTRVSRGCDSCYAFELHDKRHIAWKRGRWPSAPVQYHQPFSRVQLLPDRLRDPYHWRKPRRVFVDSMADLWHPDVPDAFILDVWLTMQANPRHTFQILTKRPERMAAWCRETFAAAPSLAMLPNVWLGVSVEDQAAADERIPHLLDTPAAIHFLSCEPLLGPISLIPEDEDEDDECAHYDLLDGAIDWVIIGGESGPHAREVDPEWIRSLVYQCDDAGVAVFCKQLGSDLSVMYNLRDRHGGDMSEWPPEFDVFRVREWPQTAREVVVAR